MKNKKMSLIKGLSIGVISLSMLATVGTIFGVSYKSWQDYYSRMLEEKEQYEKEHAPETTKMNGISVKIKDGVGFFKNGKARAIKSNFVVEGLYTIGNEVTKRDFSEELSADAYEISAPEDFAEKGGEVTFHYIEKEIEKDENGNPKLDAEGNEIEKVIYDFTETLTIDLTDVKPETLLIKHNPYIVAYEEGDRFKSDGLVIDVVNNDGSLYTQNIDLKRLTFSKAKLTSEMTSVKMSFKFGEMEEDVIYGEVPVRVYSSDEFSNGELESLEIISDGVVEAGEPLSSVKPLVYATYSSGNRLLLNETQYKINGANEVAELGKKYTITITSDENPSITSRLSLVTEKNISPVEATLSGASVYDGYAKDFDKNDYIEFTYNSTKEEAIDLSIDMSNGYFDYSNNQFITKAIDFNDFAYLSINGIVKDTSYAFQGGATFNSVSEAYQNFQKVDLGTYSIQEGENKFRISFKESNTDKESAFGLYLAGGISNLHITPASSITNNIDFGEYIKNNENPSINATKTLGWSDTKGWMYAGATDGIYAYFYTRLAGSSNVRIEKYDLESKKCIAYTSLFTLLNENHTSLFVKDGYVYTMSAEGVFMRVSTSFEGTGIAKLEPVPNMNFEKIDDQKTIKSIYFNTSKRMYVVFQDNGMFFYDANGNYLTNGKNFKTGIKITGDSNYVYVLTAKSNGNIQPSVGVYNYDGDFVKNLTINNSAELMEMSSADIGSSNIQFLLSMNGNFYFSALRWKGSNSSSLYKASCGEQAKEDVKENLALYEYISKCEKASKDPVYNSSLFSNSVIEKQMNQYAHGICSDGENIYITTNGVDGSTVVKKFNISTGKYLGKSSSFVRTDTWSNSDYLMYKDELVYVFCTDKVRAVNVNDFSLDSDASFIENPLTIDGLSGLKSGAYNSTINKMAIMTNGQLNIVGGKTLTVEKSVSAKTGLGISCDANYIYVFFEKKEANASAQFSVYDWSGNLIKENVIISNLSSGIDANNNIQGMTYNDGAFYFFVSRWTGKSQVAKVTLDTSIF